MNTKKIKYQRSNIITFCRTTDEFGGLSNMATGYPLKVNNRRIKTSEALYQTCRFPHLPIAQAQIIAEFSPVNAKKVSRQYINQSREDWNEIKVEIMYWCLKVKLVQNWSKFSKLLLKTGNKPIVELSYKDDFWGAKPLVDGSGLIGHNTLGNLLMKLRTEIEVGTINAKSAIEPPNIDNLLLLGQKIGTIV